jgi:putative ABC transport system permease protein
MSFILKMAWRDSRRNRGRLLLFISAIVVGIAALTAVRSFSYNLTKDVDREAKALLGADLLIEGNQPMPDSLLDRVRATPGAQTARVFNLLSMVYFPKSGDTRLTMVRASDPGYPFFGAWKSMPADAWETYHDGRNTLLEHGLMLQFNVAVGDSVRIGTQSFLVTGDLLSRPGRAGIGSAIAPVALVPMPWLDSTGLVQKGSRVWYQYYFKISDPAALDRLVQSLEKPLEEAKLDYETVASNKEEVGRAFGNFSSFLNLVGFIALLLGCIGVAGAVHLYIKDKLPTVAILRCLGAGGRQAFYIYLTQVAGISLLGAMAGVVFGSLLQQILPWVGRDLLPIQEVSTDISWLAAGQGLLLGPAISVLFALLPLSGILQTSPLRTLRSSFEQDTAPARLQWQWKWIIYAALLLTVAGFTWWLTGNWRETLGFLGGIASAFVILWGVAHLLTLLLRRYFPKSRPYIWRQSVANLFRPGNQTVLLVVTIGLGTMLLSTLFLIQALLLRQVAFSGSGNQPNMILFDIQTDQKDSIAALVRQKGMPVLQQVPIVTTRVETINGRTKQQDEADSTRSMPNWVWDREYRVTFRDTLIESEEILEGEWAGRHTPGQPVKISISDGLQKAMKAEIGTRIVFNVHGARLETEVGSVRKVDFSRIQTNFLVVFPKGVLEAAPQFHVLISRVESAGQSAAFQSALVRRFPTVSAIDITQILQSVDTILSKVSFVIRFMALFSILTGLLVLISSIYQSKFARIRESVLLRTLGASRQQILWINALEYFLLGALACIAGIGLSVAGAWALAVFVFKIPFGAEWIPLIVIFLAITALTVALGLLNSREVVRKPPLEVLRAEL